MESIAKKSSYEWLYSVGNDKPLFFILGPCALESESSALKSAEFLKALSEKLSFKLIFKVAFDKANRLAISSKRGMGIDKGLKILQSIKQQFDLPIITDVHEVCQVAPVAEVVDVMQANRSFGGSRKDRSSNSSQEGAISCT